MSGVSQEISTISPERTAPGPPDAGTGAVANFPDSLRKELTEPTEARPDGRGLSSGSLRSLEAIRERRIQQGRWLREALAHLLADAKVKGRNPGAKELQWRLEEAGEAGALYLAAAGYPNLRTVQRHLKAIRATTFQCVASSVSECREFVSTLDPHERSDGTAPAVS